VPALSGLILFAAPAPAAGPPQVVGTWSADVSATSARLRGEVNPNGFATGIRFEYITAAAYQANLAASPPVDGFTGALKAPAGSPTPIGSGTTALEVKPEQPGGLKSSTAYRFRIVATHAAEAAVNGPALTFITREIAPVFGLPDGRGWELVSPADKNGGQVDEPEADFGGGVLQAAAQGGAVTYGSTSSFGPSLGSPGASQYISRRGPGGWSTENVTVPLYSTGYDTSPGAGVPYRLFSGDLAEGLLSNGRRCRGEGSDCPVANPPLPGSGAPAGYRNYYLRDNGSGGYRALLTSAPVLAADDFELTVVGATPDLGQVVLSTCAALTPNAIEVPGVGGECDPAEQNLYRYSGGALALINLLPGDSQGTPGAMLAAQSAAISGDGSRVYWSDGTGLYLRDGNATKQVDAAPGGGGSFETAGADGSVAFFTKGGHLYRYLAGTDTATDITPAGEVAGILGASADGAAVYYLSASGLLRWRAGTTTAVAAAADASNYPPTTGTARVSADGSRLAFLSKAGLTGYDNTDLETRLPDSEVYLYGPAPGGGAPALTCVSCNPTLERPIGPSTIPGAIANGSAFRTYKPRVLSADGSRLFFDSYDAIADQDTNKDRDVYQWEAPGVGSCAKPAGCVSLLSSGRSADGARFIDASADGADAFFTTDASLVPGDPGSVDLYDARVGGGFPVPPSPIPCVGDACQALPGEPEDPTPGTLLVRPEGNPPLTTTKSGKAKAKPKKKQRKKKRHQGKKRARGGSAR